MEKLAVGRAIIYIQRSGLILPYVTGAAPSALRAIRNNQVKVEVKEVKWLRICNALPKEDILS